MGLCFFLKNGAYIREKSYKRKCNSNSTKKLFIHRGSLI